MQESKEHYIKLIQKSHLFSLDKNTQAFKSESYKMIMYLYQYLIALNKSKYEEYGCEITELAILCINNYAQDKGDFLHYFNKALSLKYRHLMGENALTDKFCGIKISEDDKRAVKKYLSLASKVNSDISSETLYKRLAKALDLDLDKVREIASLANVYIERDTNTQEDGMSFSLLNSLYDEKDFNTLDLDAIFIAIDNLLHNMPKRQKDLISDLITVKLYDHIYLNKADKYAFISQDIMTNFKVYGVLPTQRDLALKYGRDETSISRTLKDFINKLKKEVTLYGIK